MPDSVPLKEARQRAEEYDQQLRADDPRLRGAILMVCADGSVFMVHDAFVMRDGPWVRIHSEHYPVMLQHEDEVDLLRSYQPVYGNGNI